MLRYTIEFGNVWMKHVEAAIDTLKLFLQKTAKFRSTLVQLSNYGDPVEMQTK